MAPVRPVVTCRISGIARWTTGDRGCCSLPGEAGLLLICAASEVMPVLAVWAVDWEASGRAAEQMVRAVAAQVLCRADF